MEQAFRQYERAKEFLGFDGADVENLKAIAPLVEKHGGTTTDRFYQVLSAFPETASFVEGRVDALKKTHRAWMMGLVGGEYGRAYFDSRWRIGLAHVRIGLDPMWVEGVMSLIRGSIAGAIVAEVPEATLAALRLTSFTKVCDLDLMVINLSYHDDRLQRLTDFTGMKRALIENIIKIPKKPAGG